MSTRLKYTGLCVVASLLGGGCDNGDIEEVTAGAWALQSNTGDGDASIRVTSQWNNGYCVEVVVANRGAASISNWAATINLNNSTIYNLWNGNYTRNGSQVVVTPVAWNARIASNATSVVGFCSNSTGAPIIPTVTNLTVTTDPVGVGGSTSRGGSSSIGGSSSRGGSSSVGGSSALGGASSVGGSSGIGGTGGTAPQVLGVTMSVINDWATGYCAQVRLRNVGTANITAWSVVYDLGEGVITTPPACKYTREGTRYTFANLSEGDGFLAYPTGNTLFTYCAATPHEVDRPILVSIRAEGGILDRSGAGEQNGIRVEPTMPYDWSSGYCADVVVRNVRSTPVTSWESVINIGQSTVQNLWSASYTSVISSNGTLVTIKPLDNNRTLAAGAETKIGFCGVTTGKSYSPKFVSATAVP